MDELKFDSVDEVNQFFSKWHDYSETFRLQVLRKLQSLGKIGVLSSRTTEVSVCPKYNFLLARPCSLKQCQYYISSPESRNCLINCLNQAKMNRLTSGEVSGIVQASITEINDLSSRSTYKVKKAILKEKLDRLDVSHFSYLPGHCLGCELTIIDDLEAGVSPELVLDHPSGLFGWCSAKCKNHKPAWMFLVEQEFGCSYLDVLALAVSELKSFGVAYEQDLNQQVCSLLNINHVDLSEHWLPIAKRMREIL